MAISREEFLEWKRDPVTEEFMEICQQRVQDMKDILAATAGTDSINDNFNRGFIAAYEEVQKVDFE